MKYDVESFTTPTSPPKKGHFHFRLDCLNNNFMCQPTGCDVKNEASPNKYKKNLFPIAETCFTKLNNECVHWTL